MPPGPTPEASPSHRPGHPATHPPSLPPDMLAAPVVPAESRIDFERGMSYAPVLTLVLILANVIMFGAELATGALSSREAMISAGAAHRESVLRGEAWRLVSAIFLHGGFDHLLG